MKRRVMKKNKRTVSVTISEYDKDYINIDVPDLNKIPANVPVKITWNATVKIMPRACGPGSSRILEAYTDDGYSEYIDGIMIGDNYDYSVWFAFTRDCKVHIYTECT